MLSLLNAPEVEMLAELLSRAGVNKYEVVWANAILQRLRALAAANTGGDDDDEPTSQPRV